MLEDGLLKAAAPECRFGLGWVYHKGFCYLFTSYHIDFLKAEELCNEQASIEGFSKKYKIKAFVDSNCNIF